MLRDVNWQVIPARELVPGDIVRMRPGDIIPADVKLLTGNLAVDQSALTDEGAREWRHQFVRVGWMVGGSLHA